jgi:hypothetical protein
MATVELTATDFESTVTGNPIVPAAALEEIITKITELDMDEVRASIAASSDTTSASTSV